LHTVVNQEHLQNLYPRLASEIIREPIPIRKKEYFIIFSKKNFSKNEVEIEMIWNGLKSFNEK